MKTLQNSSLPLMAITFLSLLALGLSVHLAAAATGNDDDQPIVGTASISESAALKIADRAYPGSGRFTDIELEMEGTTLVYAIEFTETDGNEVDVKVDAKTGSVVVVESDKDEPTDDDQGDDQGDEASITKMETLVNLLNQLLALLRQQAS